MPTGGDYKIISKIEAPDGSVYDIKPSANANVNIDGIYYVSASGTTSALVGTISDLDSYYNGLKIVLYNSLGSNTAAACTLDINNLGPIPIKKAGTTNVGTIYAKSIAVLCYVDGTFFHNNYYDSNSTEDYIRMANLITPATKLLQYTLCAITSDDKVGSFTTNTSSSIGAKTLNTALKFRTGFPIFYYGGSTINANTTTTYSLSLYETKLSVDIRYSMLNYDASRISASGPTYFFMRVDVEPYEGVFKPLAQATSVTGKMDHIVCKSPSNNELIDGGFYIYLGVHYDSTTYISLDLVQNNPLYYYDGGNDLLIEYDAWKDHNQDASIAALSQLIGNSGWPGPTPISAVDLYASPEYPAIVHVEYKESFGIGADSSIIESQGQYFLYDICYIGSASNMDLDWGYALLTHNVSVGEKVDPRYLSKTGVYTLHPLLTDLTPQGINYNELPGADPNTTYPSMYRAFDASLYDFIYNNTRPTSPERGQEEQIDDYSNVLGDTQLPVIGREYSENTTYDGPTLYIVNKWTHSLDYTVPGYVPVPETNRWYLWSSIHDIATPVQCYDWSDSSATYTSYAPLYMKGMLPAGSNGYDDVFNTHIGDWISGPLYMYFGKANLTQRDGAPVSITVDFNNHFAAYDSSGNSRSLPGYPYSQGKSIFAYNSQYYHDADNSSGGGGGSDNNNLPFTYQVLSADKTCNNGADTSIFQFNIPSEGYWKIDAQITANCDTSTILYASMSLASEPTINLRNGELISTTSAYLHKAAGSTFGTANICMTALGWISETQRNLRVVLHPVSASITAKSKYGASNSSIQINGSSGYATRVNLVRISDEIVL